VLLIEPEPTPVDLHFNLFGTPVRIHPMFWVMSTLLGWPLMKDPEAGLGYLLLWVWCVFVSILLHEFGHVLVGRLFGAEGYIVLYSFGGLAVGSSAVPRRWQRAAVFFAGPLVQLLLAAVIWWGFIPWVWPSIPGDWHRSVWAVVAMLLEINVFWAVLNLLPVWPLDGGRIAREVAEVVLGRRGAAVSFGVSLVVAGLLALHCFLGAQKRTLIPFLPALGLYPAILFALLAVGSFQGLQAENEKLRGEDADDWS
jgi:stage IV sporulation protein FB